MPASLLEETPRPRVAVAPSRRRFWPWLPLCLAAALYLAASVGPALFDQNEAQYAGAVREMLDRPADYLPSARGQLERGRWYVPTNDGVPRLQKPPLVYWALLASMSVLGVNEFAARLPNALASLAWFAGIFLIGRRIGGTALGRAGATILATMAGTFIFCHLIAPEPFLAATLTWTFWCFLKAGDDPAGTGRRWMLAAWAGMALGVICKGLHGALYPLAAAAVVAWWLPATRPAWRLLRRPAGPLLFLALVTPWYAAVEMRYPGFLRDQFINEQLGHVFNRRYPPDSSQVPLYVFCLEHLLFFLPWTFFIPAALAARPAPGGGEQGRVARALLAAWFAVTAASVVFSSLQDYYLMTAWGPVALWLARPWAAGRRPLPRWTRVAPGVCLLLVGVAAFGTACWMQARANDPGVASPSALRDTLASTVSGISLEAWHRLLPLTWAAGAAFFAGGSVAVWLAARDRWRLVLPVTAMAATVVLGCAARGLVVMQDNFSLKELALVADRHPRPGTVVACAGAPNDNPSILFYINREVYWVGGTPDMEFATRQLGIGRSLYLSDDEFLRVWSDRRRTVYLIVEQDNLAAWRARLTSPAAAPLQQWQSGTRTMLCNGGG